MAFSPGNVRTYNKSEIFVPATAAEEQEAVEAVAKYRESVERVKQLEAVETLLRQQLEALEKRDQALEKRDQALEKRDKELEKRDKELAKTEQENNRQIIQLRQERVAIEHRIRTAKQDMQRIELENAQLDKVMQQRAQTMDQRAKEIQQRDAEIKALEAQLAARAKPAAAPAGKMPVQANPAAQASSNGEMPTKGPKFVVLGAIARMVLFDKQIPREKETESDRQQARTEVWPLLKLNDPKSGPITLSREKLCAQLTQQGISAVVIPCITQMNLTKCDFGAFKNEIALTNLLKSIKDLKQVDHIHFGGFVNDREVNGQNTSLSDDSLSVLAKEVQSFIQSGRRFMVSFDDASVNKKFQDLLIQPSAGQAKKALPAVPQKPGSKPAAIAIPIATGGAPQLVPNRGSPPKGQA